MAENNASPFFQVKSKVNKNQIQSPLYKSNITSQTKQITSNNNLNIGNKQNNNISPYFKNNNNNNNKQQQQQNKTKNNNNNNNNNKTNTKSINPFDNTEYSSSNSTLQLTPTIVINNNEEEEKIIQENEESDEIDSTINSKIDDENKQDINQSQHNDLAVSISEESEINDVEDNNDNNNNDNDQSDNSKQDKESESEIEDKSLNIDEQQIEKVEEEEKESNEKNKDEESQVFQQKTNDDIQQEVDIKKDIEIHEQEIEQSKIISPPPPITTTTTENVNHHNHNHDTISQSDLAIRAFKSSMKSKPSHTHTSTHSNSQPTPSVPLHSETTNENSPQEESSTENLETETLIHKEEQKSSDLHHETSSISSALALKVFQASLKSHKSNIEQPHNYSDSESHHHQEQEQDNYNDENNTPHDYESPSSDTPLCLEINSDDDTRENNNNNHNNLTNEEESQLDNDTFHMDNVYLEKHDSSGSLSDAKSETISPIPHPNSSPTDIRNTRTISHQTLKPKPPPPAASSNVFHRVNNQSDTKNPIAPLPARQSKLYLEAKKQYGDPEELKTIPDEPIETNIYKHVHFSNAWLYVTIVLHIIFYSFLLGVGHSALPPFALIVVIGLSIITPILLIIARCYVPKKNYQMCSSNVSIESETDNISDNVIYILCASILTEVLAFAMYPAISSGKLEANHSKLDTDRGLYSYGTISQILTFTAVLLSAFYRIIRPANRLDPFRTIMELEALSLCWDAMDGSSLYELLTDTSSRDTSTVSSDEISPSIDACARFLMCFWYFSIGIRVSMLFCSHISPNSYIYKLLQYPAYLHSTEPTVDRTVSAIKFKSFITIAMAFAQFFAAGLRLTLWIRGQLNTVQQSMMVKNILFFSPVGTALMWSMSASARNWNSTIYLETYISSLNWNLSIRKPSRMKQIEFFRYLFILSYCITGAMMSGFLSNVPSDINSKLWLLNFFCDILLCIIFYFTCKRIHNNKVWILFPNKLGFVLSVLLIVNLFGARVPAMYWNASEMTGATWNYTNALSLVLVSIVPIASYAMFWSISCMVFHSDFTACPENYHAIHDPAILIVSSQTMLEGALDVVSATSLLSLADYEGIPSSLDGIIICFAFLEIINACQSFLLQVRLSAGINDTPVDMIRWRARTRIFGGLIDVGVFILRLVLWWQYKSVDNLFLVKNLCNLIETGNMIERARGVQQYNAQDIFVKYVIPRDWYGIETEEEWKRLIAPPPLVI